jgi:hypothetical protein
VKEFGIERFLILRQAQDEEMDGILPLILSPVEGCGPRFDAATDSLTCSCAGMTMKNMTRSLRPIALAGGGRAIDSPNRRR